MLYVEVNAKRPGTASMEYAVDRSDTLIIGFVRKTPWFWCNKYKMNA